MAAKSKKKTLRISERMQAFLDGNLSVEDMDDEEIARGQFRSAEGDFRGRPSDFVPRKFHTALVAEQIRRWNFKVAQELDPALEALREIASGKHFSKTPADARMKAAIYLIERTAGKVPEKNEIKLEVQKWEEDIEGLLFDGSDEKE